MVSGITEERWRRTFAAILLGSLKLDLGSWIFGSSDESSRSGPRARVNDATSLEPYVMLFPGGFHARDK
jgi:hypothetical protein